jgi:phage shock protein A
MGVFRRVSDIISANVSDMVERFETPEIMLRQAIREMDAAVSRTAEAAARAIAENKLLEKQIESQRRESSGLHECARAALRRGNEPAARSALARHNDCEKLIAALDDQLTVVCATAGRLLRQLDAMRVRRSEAEHKLHIVRARQRAAEAQRHLVGGAFDGDAPHPGFSRFERICRTIERFDAETDALLELTGAGATGDESATPDATFETQFEALKRECPSSPDAGHHGTV